MWPAALITAGAAAFGRLFIAGILPSTVLTVTLWATIGADAFDPDVGPLSFSQVVRTSAKVDTIAVLLFLLTVSVLTAVLQNFQIWTVRVLEGYWGRSALSAWAVATGVRRHQRRLRTADERYRAIPEEHERELTSLRLPEQSREMRRRLRQSLRNQHAAMVLTEYPPPPEELLPTRLGNALRSAERTSGERYGWSTVDSWPRLYTSLPESLAVPFRSMVDAVDAAAAFCLTFILVAAIGTAAFYDDPRMLWFPVLAAALAFLSYRGAVIAAMIQRSFQHAAFDLHRFDMMAAMHLPLPDDAGTELKLATAVSRFFANPSPAPGEFNRLLEGFRYAHATKRSAWRSVPRDGALAVAAVVAVEGVRRAGRLVRHHLSTSTEDSRPFSLRRITGSARSIMSRRPRSSR